MAKRNWYDPVEPQSKVEMHLFKQRNDAAYYGEFAAKHRRFLIEAREKCKHFAWGDLMGFLLHDRYEHPMDKEVALFMAILVKGNEPYKIMEQCDHLHELMGSSPFKWVATRGFMELVEPDERETRLPYTTISHVHVFRMALLLYDCIKHDGNIRDGLLEGTEPARKVADTVAMQVWKALGDMKYDYIKYKVQQMLIFLATKERLGLGLWKGIDYDDYPVNADTRRFVRQFTLDRRSYYFNELIEMMGVGSPLECYYCYLAYSQIKAEHAEVLGRYERTFKSQIEKRLTCGQQTVRKNFGLLDAIWP